MTVPFTALMALLAALLEVTVLPEVPIAGATADLVLVVAVTSTLMLSIHDGLIAAFTGGLLVDMLVPQRPLGAATLSLLLVVGIAAAVARVAGPARRWLAVGLTVVLTPVLHVVMSLVLVLAEGTPLPFGTDFFTAMLVAAFMNGVLAFLLTGVFAALQRRFGATERLDW